MSLFPLFKILISAKVDMAGPAVRKVRLGDLPRKATFMYHSIADHQTLMSSFADLVRHTRLIGEHWQGRGWNAKADVCFTFDDGYVSALEPVRWLAAEGYRVIVFLPVVSAGVRYLPKDMLRIVMERLPQGERLRVGRLDLRLSCRTPYSRAMLAFRINRHLMQTCTLCEYADAMRAVESEYRVLLDAPCRELMLMRAEDVRILQQDFPNVEIGAHGSMHYRFDRLGTDHEIKKEVVAPGIELGQSFNTDVVGLAYPYGFVSDRIEAVARSHYEWAYVADPVGGPGNHRMPRVGLDGVRLVP
ncbi:MAG: hypothetical protein ABIK82_22715 [Pseudomonadota bacterium]